MRKEAFCSCNWVADTLQNEFDKAQKAFDSFANSPVKHRPPEELFFAKTTWENEIEALSVIEWGSDYHFTCDLEQTFQFKPQPSFNKNFDLLGQNLLQYKQKGYETCIFSNQAKQIERLISIFEDKEMVDLFAPIPIALQEGFVADELILKCIGNPIIRTQPNQGILT